MNNRLLYEKSYDYDIRSKLIHNNTVFNLEEYYSIMSSNNEPINITYVIMHDNLIEMPMEIMYNIKFCIYFNNNYFNKIKSDVLDILNEQVYKP